MTSSGPFPLKLSFSSLDTLLIIADVTQLGRARSTWEGKARSQSRSDEGETCSWVFHMEFNTKNDELLQPEQQTNASGQLGGALPAG